MSLAGLPEELHLKIITEHLSLVDLIAFASSNAIHHNFFIRNRALIWKALYLRDVSSTPLLNETGNGDDYRAKYLEWYTAAEYRDIVIRSHRSQSRRHQKHPTLYPEPPPLYLIPDRFILSATAEHHWHIIDIYKRFREAAGQRPDAEGSDQLTPDDLIQFRNTVQQYLSTLSATQRKNLESFRHYIEIKSHKLAQAISKYWDYDENDWEPGEEGYRENPPVIQVSCSDSGTEYFGYFLSLLPKHLWNHFVQPVLTPAHVQELSTEPTFYDNFGGVAMFNHCVGDESGGYDLQGIFNAEANQN